jgi:hypothetical protein
MGVSCFVFGGRGFQCGEAWDNKGDIIIIGIFGKHGGRRTARDNQGGRHLIIISNTFSQTFVPFVPFDPLFQKVSRASWVPAKASLYLTNDIPPIKHKPQSAVRPVSVF